MREAGKEAIDVQDHKGAWRYIRAATFTTPKGSDTLFDLAGMNEHFAEVVNSDENEPIVIDGCDQEDSFNFQIVSTQSVARLLGAVKTNTAMGSDEIPGFLVKKTRNGNGTGNHGYFQRKSHFKLLSITLEKGKYLSGMERKRK